MLSMIYPKITLFSSALFALFVLTGSYAVMMLDAQNSRGTMLFDFAKMENSDTWLIVNDGVMGGLSKSSFYLSDSSTAVFSGYVTLENNGGFASARTKAALFPFHGCKGIQIRVKGDGKKYQFRIRTDNRFDGISYRHHFETRLNEWETISLPLDQFVPVFRGRIVRDARPLSAKDIQQLGILISDKQTGEFKLEIQWIKTYE